MIGTNRSYQRKHLRAPYKTEILFDDENFVFKARTLNISEGGMLIDLLPHFPSREDVAMMISIPQFPIFRNFSLEKLSAFSEDLFPRKIIRVKCKMVRRETVTTQVDDVFRARIGTTFAENLPMVKKTIEDYVNTFASNLIYLQVLLDTYNSQPDDHEKLLKLASILGYDPDLKISELRFMISHDYKSLQWL